MWLNFGYVSENSMNSMNDWVVKILEALISSTLPFEWTKIYSENSMNSKDL